MSDGIIEVGSATFEAEVSGCEDAGPGGLLGAVVRPVPGLAPELEKLAASVGERAKFVKMNVDEKREIAIRYSMMSIPTIAKFEGGSRDRVRSWAPGGRTSSAGNSGWCEPLMPTYDLTCEECGERFERFLTRMLRDEDRVCPPCGSIEGPPGAGRWLPRMRTPALDPGVRAKGGFG